MEKNISRRRFLKNSAATSVSLIIGLNSKGILATNKTNTVINPFVRMDQEGFVTVIAKHFENGQGISTGLATLLAEEMDADWEKVKVEFAPANAEQYKHTFWGYQATGNSESIANSFMQYRAAGAMAKDLMIRAASTRRVARSNLICRTHGKSCKSLHCSGGSTLGTLRLPLTRRLLQCNIFN